MQWRYDAVMSTEDPALLAMPAFALAHIGRAARGAIKGTFEREGLSFRAHFVLLCLNTHGGLSQRELADRVGMDRSDLVKLLDGLETSGRLRRAPDPHDRRRHLLSITPEGAATLKRGEHLVGQATDQVLGRLSDEERATLHRLTLRALGSIGR